jgi:hypothetical protein
MKTFVLLVMLAAAGFGQSNGSQKAPAKTPAKAEQPKEVPKGAEKLSDHEWRYVDKAGKAWIYRRTPFSVAKFPEELAASEKATARDAGAPMQVREVGDSVEFTRKTPFGVNTWVKKKSELTDIEKSAWESATKKQEQE